MKTRLLNLLDRHITAETRRSLDRYHRARMFVGMAWFMTTMSPVYAVGHALGGAELQAWVALVEGSGFGLALLLFHRTQRLRVAVHLFIGVLFSMLAYKAFLAGGLTLAGAASLGWLLICPLVATLLASTRAGAIWTLATLGVYTWFYAIAATGGSLPSLIAPDEATLLFYTDMVGLGLALTVLGSLFSYGKKLALQSEEHHAWLASFPQRSTELIAEVTADGRIAYANPAMKSRFPDLEMKGSEHPFLSNVQPNQEDVPSNETIVCHVEVDGQTYAKHLSAVPGGNIRIYARDVTKQRQYEDGLREAKERAEEMVRLKDAFVANMSHELRTPLAGILGFTDIIAEEVPSHVREFVQLIRISGERLQVTLDSVLSLARLEANDMQLRCEPVDLIEEIDDIITLMQRRARDKDLALHWHADLSAEESVAHADRGAVSRIMTNLLDNAIKFTERGSVSVTAESEGDVVLVRVDDTGIGIDRTFLPHLFVPFKQASQGLNRDYEGAGLGLTISRRLAHLMGGDLSVESVPGEGTTVRLRLPRHVENDSPAPTPVVRAGTQVDDRLPT